jgi:hypothetical protein
VSHEPSGGAASHGFGEPPLEHLIALVPDPAEPAHAAYFDAVLEGVEEAIADAGYLRDRHWFPWAGNDTKKRSLRCWESEPGVILYRPTHDVRNTPGIALLLVGETPTWGLRRDQLERALEWIEAFEAWGNHRAGPRTPPQVRILGPTFSGTAASLAATLAANPNVAGAASEVPPYPYKVVSGSATSPDVARTLAQVPLVDYSASVPSDDDTLAALTDFLETHGGEVWSVERRHRTDSRWSEVLREKMQKWGLKRRWRSNVALLSESGTRYGELRLSETPSDQDQDRRKTPDQNQEAEVDAGRNRNPGQHQNDGKRAGDADNGLEPWQFQTYKFPPNLVSIRRAYQNVESMEVPLLVAQPPADAKGIRQESRGELSDQTPIIHDTELRVVLDELNNRRTRFLGIVATDARDVIFMAGRIKSQLPDMRLFTLGFDIRYLHAKHAHTLNGMLVAHAPARGRLRATPLRNELTGNVYFATRHLLGGRHLRVARPRVSVIGNGQLWPLQDVRRRASHWTPLGFRMLEVFGVLFFFGVLLTCLAPSIVLRLCRRSKRIHRYLVQGLRWRGRIWGALVELEHEQLKADDALVTTALLVCTGAVPAMLFCAEFYPSPGLGFWIAAMVLVALGIGASWFRVYKWHSGSLRVEKAPETPAESSASDALGASTAAKIFATAALIFALSSIVVGWGGVPQTRLHLLSGASSALVAVLGLITVGSILWCWRLRLRFLDGLTYTPLAPRSKFEKTAPPIATLLGENAEHGIGLYWLEQRLLQSLRSMAEIGHPGPAIICGAGVICVLLCLWLKPPHTFEPGPRNWLIVAFAIAVMLAVTAVFARLLTTWHLLDRMLRRLGEHPVASAFERLPKRLRRSLDQQLTYAGTELDDLVHPVRALRRVAALRGEHASAAASCEDDLESALREGDLDRSDDETPDDRATTASSRDPANVIRVRTLVQKLLNTGATMSGERKDLDSEVCAAIDDYLAALVAVFIPRYVRQLRSMLPPLLLGSVIAVMLSSLYLFQPQRLVSSVISLWVVVIVMAAFVAHSSLAHIPIMRQMQSSKSSPLAINTALFWRLAAWGLVPIASIVATKYPEFGLWVASAMDSFAKGL